MDKPSVYKGKIVALQGSFGSGLAQLWVDHGVVGGTVPIYCDNASTVRALHSCFGNVIGAGHTINNDPEQKPGHIGKEIYYALDDCGLVLGWFVPVDLATEELVKAYMETEEEVPA